jgi:ribosome maturation factor RimP
VDLLKRIEAIIEEPLNARGYAVVQVQLIGANRKVLQLMVERLDDSPVTVDDCATASRLVSVLLDVQDPIKDPFTLEVSSPGLERPLVKLKDYQRFCGQLVSVTTHQPINGRKRFQGRLTSVDENEITLGLGSVSQTEEPPSVVIELANIRAARLCIDFEKRS